MLELIGERPELGEALAESEAQKADRLIRQRLRELNWTVKVLQQRRKGDKVKVGIAKALRAETTMTWAWIAQRLGMGHWRTAANAVRMTAKNKS